MSLLAGFPSFEVQFDKQGKIHDQGDVDALVAHLNDAPSPVTDLFVISHGWNNDMAEARDLYAQLFGNIRSGLDTSWVEGLDSRSFAILTVLWPSKKFADEELIPSGAASLEDAVTVTDLRRHLDDLADVFDDAASKKAIGKARKLVTKLDDDPDARREFGDILKALLDPSGADEDVPAEFWTRDGDEIIQELAAPLVSGAAPTQDFESGGAAVVSGGTFSDGGTAAGIFDGAISGIKAGARRLMNLVTYWEMKDRAGKVGRNGLNPLLRRIRADHGDLNLHLIGHSFGARVVTAAIAGESNDHEVRVQSLSLLQAAFSHYGFADNYEGTKDGTFRRVVSHHLVEGPFLVTFTALDTAVGLAYPLASRIARQVAEALGDANDRYGGLGRNGAQKTPEATTITMLRQGTGTYEFTPDTVTNLDANEIITSHGDVRREEVAYAILAAVAAT